MTRRRLSIATTDYDHFRDFRAGTVRAEGIDPVWSLLTHHEVFARFTFDREWDVAELSIAKFSAQVTREDADIIALPVVASRLFRFGAIYVNAASGIRTAADLAGKKVGVPEWAHSAAVWMRGWLGDEAGVRLQDIHWHQAGVNTPGRIEKVELSLPEGVRLTRVADRSLSDMLAEGELDACIIARPPACFTDGHPDVVRLFPDFQEREVDSFRRTGVWPVMHLITMKRSVLDEDPWVARNLFNAFLESKRRSVERLLDPAVSRYPLPWLPAYAASMAELMGGDPFPFGVEENRPTWEAILRYTYEQGIAHRHAAPEDIFPPSVSTQVIV